MCTVRLVGKAERMEPVGGVTLVEEEGLSDLDLKGGRHAIDISELVEAGRACDRLWRGLWLGSWRGLW